MKNIYGVQVQIFKYFKNDKVSEDRWDSTSDGITIKCFHLPDLPVMIYLKQQEISSERI